MVHGGGLGQSEIDFHYIPNAFKKNRDTGYRPAEFGRNGRLRACIWAQGSEYSIRSNFEAHLCGKIHRKELWTSDVVWTP